MNGKIIKGIMAVLLVCSISVPLSGCAFAGVAFRENAESWWDDFWENEDSDEDDKKDPSTDDGTNSGNEDDENGGNTNIETETFIGNGDERRENVCRGVFGE